MNDEEDLKKFAKYMEENERAVMNLLVQNFINNTKNDDIAIKLKNMTVLSFSSMYFANFFRSSSSSMSYKVG